MHSKTHLEFQPKFTHISFLKLFFCLVAFNGFSNNARSFIEGERITSTPTITASLDYVCYPGSPVTLTVTGCTGTVNWFRTNSNYSPWNGTPTGTSASAYIYANSGFYVSCTDNGIASDISDTVYVDVTKIEVAAEDNLLCTGGSITLSSITQPSTGVDFFKWRSGGVVLTGETNSTLIATNSGSYSLEVNYLGGCNRTSSSFAINSSGVLPNPIISGYGETKVSTYEKVFDKRFGGNNDESIVSMIKTPANEIILGGTTNSSPNGIDLTQNQRGQFDYLIVKTDSVGNKIWDKRYGGGYNSYFSKICQTTSGNLMLFGTSNNGISQDKTVELTPPNTGPIEDIWVVKLDANGDKIWDKKYGGSLYEKVSDVLSLPNNEFLIAGSSNSDISGEVSESGRGNFDYWLCKIDSTGAILWEKRFGGAGSDVLVSIAQTNDGGFILGGNSTSSISGEKSEGTIGSQDIWIIKVNSTGTVIWDKTYNSSPMSQFMALADIKVDQTSGIIISANNQNNDGIIYRLNSLGGLLLQKTISSLGVIKQINSNAEGILLFGQYFPYGSYNFSNPSFGQSDAFLIQLDFGGNLIWDKLIGGTSSDSFNSFIEDEGNIIIGGHSSSAAGFDKTQNSRGNQDFWLVQMTSKELQSTPLGISPTDTLNLVVNNCPGDVSWTGPSNGTGPIFQITPAANSTYTANCNAYGCVSSSSVAILPNCSDNFEIVVKDLLGNPLTDPQLCLEYPSFVLESSGCSGLVTWSTTETGNSITVSPTAVTQYTATCGGSACAPAVKKINIGQFEIPTITVLGNPTFCEGDSVKLISNSLGSGYSLSWFKDQAEINNDSFEDTLKVISSGSFKVRLSKNGCTSFSNSTSTTMNYIPSPPTFSSPEYFTCFGSSVLVTASGCNGLYQWWNGDTGPSNYLNVYYSNSNSYTVTCTENDCESDPQMVTITIGENSIAGENERYFCNPQTITLSTIAPPGSTIQWYKNDILIQNQNNFDLTVNEKGDFKSKASFNGCLVESNSVQLKNLDSTSMNVFQSIELPNLKDTVAILYDKSYGGISSDWGNDIIMTADGNFLIIGTSYSGITGNKALSSKGKSDVYLIKVDSNGNKIWEKSYGTSSYDEGLRAVISNDGNIFVLANSFDASGGDKTDMPLGDIDYWLLKLDNNGNKIWDKIYGTFEFESSPNLIKTTDGNYLIFGGQTQLNFSAAKFSIYKVNDAGNTLWHKTFNGGLSEVVNSAINTYDGGYIFAGSSNNLASSFDKSQPSNGGYDLWLVKTDSEGNKIWDKSYGGTNTEINPNVIQLADSSLLIGSTSYSGIGGNKSGANLGQGDFWLLKTDSLGIPIWDNTYGGSNNDIFENSFLNLSNNLIMMGSTISPKSNNISEESFGPANNYQNTDAWVLEIDPIDGSVIWDKRFGGTLNDEINSGINVNDNLYFLGSSYSQKGLGKMVNNYGNADFWLIKAKQTHNFSDTSQVTIELGKSVNLFATGCPGEVTWSNTMTGSDILVSPNGGTVYTATCTYNSCSTSSSILVKVISCVLDLSLNQLDNILTGTPTNPVSVNAFSSVEAINSVGQVGSTASAKYVAGENIMLNPGFKVEAGSVFQAKISIDPCND